VSGRLSDWRAKIAKAAFLSLAATVAAACATGPVYKPRAPGESVGYTDRQLTENRFRVTYSGNSAIKREDVENFLLRRAAEVTLAAGYTHFVFDDRDTQARTYYREAFNSFDPIYGYPYFGPRAWYWSSWPYFPPYGRYGFGYGGYGGFGYGDLRPVTSYSAYAEIVTLNPGQAASNPAAIDARSLLQRIVPPEPPATAGSSTRPSG
jgi:hypothetical protein